MRQAEDATNYTRALVRRSHPTLQATVEVLASPSVCERPPLALLHFGEQLYRSPTVVKIHLSAVQVLVLYLAQQQ